MSLPLVLRRAAALAAAVALAPGSPAAQTRSPAMQPRIELRACRLPELEETVRCGELSVPENRATSSGRRIALRVVVLPRTGRAPGREAVFYLSGGPGQSAVDGAASVAGELARLRPTRDIVLVDQRGTGASNPLRCELPTVVETVRALTTLEFAPGRLERCAHSLPADPRQYTTLAAAQDLEAVRRALGYGRVDLFGVSYGTRLGLVFLRAFPGSVRTVALRGVSPTDLTLPLFGARDADRALGRLFAACAAEARCRAAYPDPAADLRRALAGVESREAYVALGDTDSLQVTRPLLGSAVLFALYATGSAAQLPSALHEAAAGRYDALVESGLSLALLASTQITLGAYLSVVCAEDVPWFTEADIARETRGTTLGGTLATNARAACARWPHGSVPAAFREPVRAGVPVLLISGEEDPVTPPEWAERVARTLPAARSVVLPGTGHIPSLPPCAAEILARFIDRGTGAGLDTSCLAGVRRPPFVVPEAGPTTVDTASRAAPGNARPADLTGRWTLLWKGASGLRDTGGYVVLEQTGTRLKGVVGGRGEIPVQGEVRDDSVHLAGRRIVAFRLDAVVRGVELEGVFRAATLEKPFIARRAGAPRER